METIFISPTKGKLTTEKVVSEIVDFIGEDKQVSYTLVIGTDSQERRLNGVREVNFVTAVVIHRHGKGGRYFWTRTKKQKIYSLRDKIYAETLASLELAQNLVPLLKNSLYPLAPYDLEIHIDVGEVGPTREMIKEVVGMVAGNGFTAKTKPESYGAFVVADKHT
ncbi:hypothetical protein COU95_03545 [Candidatus Shapirobacteria bacterium CG10_big_fil_rev_8_21_14_0_10_40_9]|uniref:Uncharacterized protein n=1 Tax=Candidatus Shapirobacteria bacterium CG10_big_fil_rev_8_21_14_0_10_40_9 TaxID=1974888 RepID=A0A2M8L2V0_9BACT|nr:MAG: hypothetical protein COU95_03545 [Candidatus Shapirobacteria bacterium CG10_big_fil_rev_8_21_14_0_10_40_9]